MKKYSCIITRKRVEMNMFTHELRANRRTTIIWICSLAFVTIFFLSLFPSFAHNADELKKILLGYPEVVRKVIGLSIDTIATLPGFYSYCFLYIVLTGSIQAMNLGTSIISKEIREKTADFLLTKPVSRPQILSAKLLAALTSLTITNVVYLIVANIMASIVSPGYDGKTFVLISLSLFFVQLMFLAMGILTSVIFQKIKSVISISLGTVFSFFIINAFATTTNAKELRYFSPFQYFDATYINKHGSYENVFLIIEVVFIVLAIFASYIIYNRKDVDAV